MFLVRLGSDFLGQHLDDFRARINDPIFPMAHAHHQPPLGEAFGHEVGSSVRTAHFLRHFERSLIGSAMQRTIQRSHGCGQRGCGRRQSGCHDAGGERAGVEAVIDLQNLRTLENADFFFRRPAVMQQLQKPFAVTAGLRIGSRRLAGAQGDQHGMRGG